MPRIEPYTQQTSVSGIPGTPTIRPLSAGAEALQSLGEIGSKAAISALDRQRTQQERDAEKARAELERQQDAQAAADAYDKVSTDHLSLIKYQEDLQQTFGSGDPKGYSDQVAAKVKEMRDATLKTIDNPKAKVHAQQQYASMAGGELIRAVGWEHVRGREYAVQQFDNGTDTDAAIVASDATQYEIKRDAAHARAEFSNVPGMTEKMKDAADRKLRIGATEGQLVRNPANVLQSINARFGLDATSGITSSGLPPLPPGAPADLYTAAAKDAVAKGQDHFTVNWAGQGGPKTIKVADVLTPAAPDPTKPLGKSGVPYIDALTPEEAVKYRNQALAEVNSGNGIAKANLASTFRDMNAMAEKGLQHPNPPSDEQIVAIAGPNAPDLIREKQRIQAMGTQIDAFKGQSKSQIRDSLKASDPGVDQAAGFAPEQGRQNVKGQSASIMLNAREKDAGAWVAQNVSGVTQAYAAAFGPPGGQPTWLDPKVPMEQRKAAMAAFFTASAAEQARLEIDAVSILPDGVKQQISQMATMSKGSGDRMAQDIKQMSEVFGDNWQRVYKEVLQSNHATSVPASWIVLAAIPNKAGAEQIARLDGVKIEEMKKGLPKGADKTVDEGMQSGLQTWNQSMMTGSENNKTYQAVREVATKWAYNAIIGGASDGDAIKQGIDMVIGHYEFANDWSTKSYGIPKTENPALVREGVDIAMRRLDKLNLTPPPDKTGLRTMEEKQRSFARGLQSGAMWVTNEKEDGLLLFTQGENGAPIKVLDAGGQQVDMKFETLRAYAQEARALRPAETTQPTEGGAPGYVVGGVRYRTQDEATAAQAEAFRARGKVGQ